MRLLKLIPDNTNIGFVRLRAWAFGLTAILTIAAAVLVGVRGLNFGVDFKGGVMIEAHFQAPPQENVLRSDIDRMHVGEASLSTFGDASTYSIRLPLPTATDEGATNRLVKNVQGALSAKYPGVVFNRAETVSSKVSDELIRNAFFNGSILSWQIIIPDFGTVSGPFQATALEYSGEHNGEVTFDIALESAGVISFGAL